MAIPETKILRYNLARKPNIAATYALLCQVYRMACEELSQKTTAVVAQAALADTLFADLDLTQTGFEKSQAADDVFTNLPSDRIVLKNFQSVIDKFCAGLANNIEPKVLAEKIRQSQKIVQNETGILVKINSIAVQSDRKLSIWQNIWDWLSRKKSEESKKATFSREQVQQILANIAEGVLLVDIDHKILFANKAVSNILDLPVGHIEGRYVGSVLDLQDHFSRLSEVTYMPYGKDTQQGIFYVGKNLKLTTHTNHIRTIDLHCEQFLGSDKLFLLIIHTNVAVNSEANEQELFSITAHEMKTPLTALRGYLAILQDELTDTLSADQTTMLNRTHAAANELLSLIENVLAINKIEHNNLALHLEAVTYEDVITTVCDQLLPLASEKRVKIVFERPQAEIPHLVCDRIRVTEVLTNLITNAIKFNKIGGGVWVRIYCEGDTITTEVSDNGIGISTDAIAKLFHKYTQLDTNDAKQPGTGLGLYIAKQIIKSHGGEIWVSSAKDCGSTFAFRLPLTAKINNEIKPQPKRTFHAAGQSLQLVN